MTDRQDDSVALRELVAKWRHNPKARASHDEAIRDECADELERVMKALSPQGSEPAGMGDAMRKALESIVYFIDEGGNDAIWTIERVAKAAIAAPPAEVKP